MQGLCALHCEYCKSEAMDEQLASVRTTILELCKVNLTELHNDVALIKVLSILDTLRLKDTWTDDETEQMHLVGLAEVFMKVHFKAAGCTFGSVNQDCKSMVYLLRFTMSAVAQAALQSARFC